MLAPTLIPHAAAPPSKPLGLGSHVMTTPHMACRDIQAAYTSHHTFPASLNVSEQPQVLDLSSACTILVQLLLSQLSRTVQQLQSSSLAVDH